MMLNRPMMCALITLLAFTLSSCGGSTNVKPDVAEPAAIHAPRAETPQANTLNPKDLIAQAQQKTSPSRETLLLQAAQLYWVRVFKSMSQSLTPFKSPKLVVRLSAFFSASLRI